MRVKSALRLAGPAAATLLSALGPLAFAQSPAPYCPPKPPAACPTPGMPGVPLPPPAVPGRPAPTAPGTLPAPTPPPGGATAPPAAQTPDQLNAAPAVPDLATGQAATGDTGTVALSAPNMNGNLLGANKSVQYFINRASGTALVSDFGATTITNVKIAENNSPEPRDRISLRYGYFNNAAQVVGISEAPETIFLDGTRQFGLKTREFDLNQYNLQIEKTFWDGLWSVEVRVPINVGLSPTQNISVGRVSNISPTQTDLPNGVRRFGFWMPTSSTNAPLIQSADFPGGTGADIGLVMQRNLFTIQELGRLQAINNTLPADQRVGAGQLLQRAQLSASQIENLQGLSVTETSVRSLGQEGTYLADMSVILKSVAYKCHGRLVSGGLALTIPTGPDAQVRVTDYIGGRTNLFAEVQRVREFEIQNETWGLSPFLGFLLTPNDTFFLQGFGQVEIPLNPSNYSFYTTFPITGSRRTDQVSEGLFAAQDAGSIREQTLLHLDIGGGFWLVRNPNARFLTGVAPAAELHYTTTLQRADVVSLPIDNSFIAFGSGRDAPPQTPGVVASPSLIGNLRNRVDILDATVGTTFEFARRATLATAFVLPIGRGDDRTFDWEFQLQFNYYFGGTAGDTFAPNVIGG